MAIKIKITGAKKLGKAIRATNRSLKRITKNTIGLANEYIKKNPSIKNRAYTMKLEGEFSSLKYEITASGSIISKMHKALEKILNKHPKEWEKDIKYGDIKHRRRKKWKSAR